MIQMRFMGVNWGVDSIEETDPETGAVQEGSQINLLDPHSGILVQVPFSGESLLKLTCDLAESLTQDQRRQLAGTLTGGLVIPNGNLPQDWDKGPQG